MTKVNPVSFGGIRKVTTFVLPVSKNKKLTEVSAVIQDGFVTSYNKKQAGSPLLKVTQFFAKNDKLVGNHIEYPNGNYRGTRTFANGLQMSYSATKSIISSLFISLLFEYTTFSSTLTKESSNSNSNSYSNKSSG